ncbi:MAG TPA: FG-GAP-like repeat-containing protein, partial [Flavisolibacter sp.]|nr:FG-GAP-like repeat-containing protein [Flavisolibacter sp.]
MRTPRTLPLMGFCTHRLFRFVLFLTVSLQVQLLAAQKPVITSFTPAKGPIGTAIVISGANFSTVPANNTVFFGDVRGVVTSASSNELTVVAPAGASYKPLTVTTNGLTTYATKPFILTFQGGSGGFTSYSFPERLDSLFEVNPAALAASDLDGDGQPDLVVTNRSANQVTIRRNTGNPGKISFAPRLQFPTGNSPAGIAIADLDGDGKADIVVANSSGNTLSVLKNKSVVDTISFFPKIDLAAGSLPFYCAIGDVDGDGKPDILCTNAVSNTLSVFRNTSSAGNLQFSPKIDFPTGSDPAGLVLVDLDGDGVQEIAVANENGASISVYRNRSTAGTFLLDTKVDFANTFRPTTLFAADIDDDGKTDLVAGSGNAAVFTVVKNRTAGGNLLLDPAVHFPTGHGASQTISLGDVDGDGKIDVAANHYLYTQVSLIRNESVADTLRFSARRDYTASDITTQALLADLDLDGRPDLLTANGNGSVSTFRNVITKPYVTSFTPTTAGHGAVVTINGGNFSETSAVSIGGSPVKSFVVESPEKILAVVDTGASGDVVVTTTYGSGKLPGFSYSRVPTIQSFTPTNGQGGTVVTLQGTNFVGATTVLFDGQPAASFQVLSPTFIQATAPPLAAGSYDVKVTTPFGTATKPGFYTGVTINSFFPTTGASGTI